MVKVEACHPRHIAREAKARATGRTRRLTNDDRPRRRWRGEGVGEGADDVLTRIKVDHHLAATHGDGRAVVGVARAGEGGQRPVGGRCILTDRVAGRILGEERALAGVARRRDAHRIQVGVRTREVERAIVAHRALHQPNRARRRWWGEGVSEGADDVLARIKVDHHLTATHGDGRAVVGVARAGEGGQRPVGGRCILTDRVAGRILGEERALAGVARRRDAHRIQVGVRTREVERAIVAHRALHQPNRARRRWQNGHGLENAAPMCGRVQGCAKPEQFIHRRIVRPVMRQRPGGAVVFAGKDAYFGAGIEPTGIGRVDVQVAHRHKGQTGSTRTGDIAPVGAPITRAPDIAVAKTAKGGIDNVGIVGVNGQACDIAVRQRR